MTQENRLISYMTLPENEAKISKNEVADLRNYLKNFDYNKFKNHHIFINGDIEIRVSYRGTVFISAISPFDLSYSLYLISRLTNKINSIISIDNFSRNINISNI